LAEQMLHARGSLWPEVNEVFIAVKEKMGRNKRSKLLVIYEGQAWK
jgi:hypothetical protein